MVAKKGRSFSNASNESIITENNQIVLPELVRDKTGLEPGDILVWEYDENNKTIIASKKSLEIWI
ncbi:hypothetical protein HX99_03405 [Peptococcaceae bacterium SCADC1_2_3]|nr:hypothetical protein DK28_0210225 [Peptococcaceae bacterium SCADC1_2_3]KFI36566.1 hypothetical protein HX99_03405 [Peptococcaceae bacterium SCADC1_2_3]